VAEGAKKVDEKGGGSERAEMEDVGDGVFARECIVQKRKQSKSSGKNRSSSPRKIGANG